MSHALTLAAMRASLQEKLAPTHLELIDESAAHAGHSGARDDGHPSHVRVRVASPLFAGRSRVACHRLVYDALHDFMARGLHALAIELIRPV